MRPKHNNKPFCRPKRRKTKKLQLLLPSKRENEPRRTRTTKKLKQNLQLSLRMDLRWQWPDVFMYQKKWENWEIGKTPSMTIQVSLTLMTQRNQRKIRNKKTPELKNKKNWEEKSMKRKSPSSKQRSRPNKKLQLSKNNKRLPQRRSRKNNKDMRNRSKNRIIKLLPLLQLPNQHLLRTKSSNPRKSTLLIKKLKPRKLQSKSLHYKRNHNNNSLLQRKVSHSRKSKNKRLLPSLSMRTKKTRRKRKKLTQQSLALATMTRATLMKKISWRRRSSKGRCSTSLRPRKKASMTKLKSKINKSRKQNNKSKRNHLPTQRKNNLNKEREFSKS